VTLTLTLSLTDRGLEGHCFFFDGHLPVLFCLYVRLNQIHHSPWYLRADVERWSR
jgi:hypothetical protein